MADDEAPRIDSDVPHSARIWNYWLGGKDHYVPDREVGDAMVAVFPGMVDIARASRYFLARAVRFLAGEAGVRQFLDIGTGLPTEDNTHEVAQRVASDSRIVYVDNDPMVLAHARALLTSTPQGLTEYIDADIHDPAAILRGAARTLDFSQPVALMLLGIVGHIPDLDDANSVLRQLVGGLPPGSYLVLNDGTNFVGVQDQPTGQPADESARAQAIKLYAESGATPYHLRSPKEITEFFDGLELAEPGVVSTSQWRPEHTPFGTPEAVDAYCGVARKL